MKFFIRRVNSRKAIELIITERKNKYFTLINGVIPKRSPLHLACIDGDEAGTDGINALGICYEMKFSMIEQYLHSIASHHINKTSLYQFAAIWNEFIQVTEHLWQQAKL